MCISRTVSPHHQPWQCCMAPHRGQTWHGCQAVIAKSLLGRLRSLDSRDQCASGGRTDAAVQRFHDGLESVQRLVDDRRISV